ncbi:MAG: aminoacyl-histidine dipeptidase [Bacteroidaceae bacterium]|jgi:dipeptidase D
MVYDDLQPQNVFRFFKEICNIPRPSGHEQEITEYLRRFAAERNLWHETDERGNTLIRKPATPGKEAAPGIVLQAHTDMVPEKRKDVEHDFLKDPIQTVIDGEWLHAKGTTLGADNGIGMALALAALDSNEIEHGPLEALFTVDEEVGLGGAECLKEGWLQSSYLLNLDSEEEGLIYVGCAGGNTLTATWKCGFEPSPEDFFYAHIALEGLAGGHSGSDIDQGHANAIKLMSSLLGRLLEEGKFDLRICTIEGGSKHNAIPLEASATVGVRAEEKENLRVSLNLFAAEMEREYKKTDPGMKWTLTSCERPAQQLNPMCVEEVITALTCAHTGVYAFSQESPEFVHTSNNIAILSTDQEGNITVLSSQRSESEFSKEEVTRCVTAAFRLAHADRIVVSDDYPGWEPVYNSHLLEVAQASHRAVTGHDAVVKTIHAGLECGLIGKKYPGMEMISIGPTLRGVHTPEEKLHIPSLLTAWKHICSILANL